MTENASDFIQELAEHYALHLIEQLRTPSQEKLIIEGIDDWDAAGPAAESRVYDILTVGGASAWQLILAIVKALPNDEAILGALGAGVFEYPWCDEDKVFAARADLEQCLRTDPKLRSVVRSCWSTSETLDEICARVGLQRSWE